MNFKHKQTQNIQAFALTLQQTNFKKENICMYYFVKINFATLHFELNVSGIGGFQLLDLIIPELKSHVIPYKFKCSHWWKIHL